MRALKAAEAAQGRSKLRRSERMRRFRSQSNKSQRISRTNPTAARRRLSFEPLEERRQLSVSPIILGDAFIDRDSTQTSRFAEINGTTLFWGDDGVHGVELWRTDGTQAGTAIV